MFKKSLLWILLIAILSLSCSPERGDWKKAKSQNSIEAYEEYLAKYPEGKHAAEAREKITDLHYQQAESASTIEAYEEYLAKYPAEKYASTVRERITQLHCEQAYEQAESVNTIEAYEEFLKRYPNGPFGFDAKEAIRKKKSGPFDATVVDRQGDSFLVKGVKAVYRAEGIWGGTGPVPGSSEAAFHMIFETEEGHVTVKEEVKVPFYEIRRIDFAKTTQIHKKDGSSLLISGDRASGVLREKDGNGKTIREIRADRIRFSTRTAHRWEGFRGRTKGKTGQEAEYSIDEGRVKSIVFEEE